MPQRENIVGSENAAGCCSEFPSRSNGDQDSAMNLRRADLQEYLTQLLGADVQLSDIRPLSDREITVAESRLSATKPQSLKVAGYGKPVLITYRKEGETEQAVLHTATSNHFGHEFRSDRAAEMLLSYDTYSELPGHAEALDFGVYLQNDQLHSLGNAKEFFLLTSFVPGQSYAKDLDRLLKTGVVLVQDRKRARTLAHYLANIHGVKRSDPPLYARRIRDTVGSGEGIMGLCDSYPATFAQVPPRRLEALEHACLRWRWRIKTKSHRLSQVHGDFHPFNILFENDDTVHLLDRSRGAWGEPADDLAALSINYLFFSLMLDERLVSPFTELWNLFWSTYLDQSEDDEVLDVIAPFFAWRALVLASPSWYNVSAGVRELILTFAENVLRVQRFDPQNVADYLGSSQQQELLWKRRQLRLEDIAL